MIFEHDGRRPTIAPSARIAPTAVICGGVTIGEHCSIGFGAILTAESGPVTVGDNCVIMDTAVLRGVHASPLAIGKNVLIGPRAYLTGCAVEDNAFIATGATIFNGAIVGRAAEVRINGIVHIRTALPEGAIVPLGWIAIGDPAHILQPESHDDIWAIQRELNFARFVWGVEERADGASLMPDIMPRYAKALARRHADDKELE